MTVKITAMIVYWILCAFYGAWVRPRGDAGGPLYWFYLCVPMFAFCLGHLS